MINFSSSSPDSNISTMKRNTIVMNHLGSLDARRIGRKNLILAFAVIAAAAILPAEDKPDVSGTSAKPEAAPEPAADPAGRDVSVSLSTALQSAYVWRGITVNDEPVIQPSVEVVIDGLTINVWVNGDMTTQTDRGIKAGQVSETDLTMYYTKAFGPDELYQLSFGCIDYLFPSAGTTTEFFVSFGMDTIASPAITIYRDVDLPALYASLGASHKHTVNESIEIEASAAIGLGDSNWGKLMFGLSDDDASFGLYDVSVVVSATYALTAEMSISVTATVSSVINSDAADALDAADIKTTTAVIGLAWSMSL